jgi:hypothetical protein
MVTAMVTTLSIENPDLSSMPSSAAQQSATWMKGLNKELRLVVGLNSLRWLNGVCGEMIDMVDWAMLRERFYTADAWFCDAVWAVCEYQSTGDAYEGCIDYYFTTWRDYEAEVEYAAYPQRKFIDGSLLEVYAGMSIDIYAGSLWALLWLEEDSYDF